MFKYKTPQPEEPYGVAKLAVEMDLRCAHEMFGLNYVIFRPHNVYGEYQNLIDPYRNVIGNFMKQILEDRPMAIFGPPRNEVVQAFCDDPKARAVFGTGTETSLDECLPRMADWAPKIKFGSAEGFRELEVTKNMPPNRLKHQAHTSVAS